VLFFISNFGRVLNVVCFLIGNSPASEFLYADVSEHSLCSIFPAGDVRELPEENKQHSEHGVSFK
jgi:hypothetical protein